MAIPVEVRKELSIDKEARLLVFKSREGKTLLIFKRVLEEKIGKEESSPQSLTFRGGCSECGGMLDLEEGYFIC